MANRDRLGELIEFPAPGADRHPVDCSGWAGEDPFGRPLVCAICRPESARRIRDQHRRDFDGARWGA